MNSPLLVLLSFLIAFQLLFVAIFLFTHKKGKKQSNRILATLFLLIGLNLTDMTLQFSGVKIAWGFLQVIDDSFFLLYGPLFFYYVKSMVYRDYRLTYAKLIHGLPYLLFTILLLLSNNLSNEGLPEAASIPWYVHVISTSFYLHILVYLVFALIVLKEFHSVIKQKFSQIDHINLDWLMFSAKALGGITIISLIHNYQVLSGNIYFYSFTIILLLLFIFYFVNRVIFKALKQPEIFAGIEIGENEKYAKSALTTEQVEHHKSELLNLFDESLPFLDSELTIAELAEKLELSTKNLSQVINQSFDKNFYDLVNSYRIKEAQSIMENSSDQKLTVLEVMYKVGFNSKSSFNTAFRKETGKTPTEYRKSIV